MVKKDIENIIDQNKVINQNNIIDLADYFLNKMNLKKYVKNINFDDSYCSFYDNETFEINLNYNQMIEYAISNYSDSYCVNYEMIFYLLHEISHSLQTKIIYENKQKLLASIYEDSYDRIKYFYDLYQTYHDDFLIDGKFIKIFVENYIKNNNLENHYDGVLIDFLSPYMGVYLLDQKKIIINLDLFVKNALNIKGEYNIFDFPKDIIYKLNIKLISTIYHELNHISQRDEKIKIIKDLYDNCYGNMKKDINNYYKYHKYYLTEWNANIKAELYLDKFLDELIKIDQNVINKRINDRINIWYDLMYKESDGLVISPLEYYCYYTNQNYNSFLYNLLISDDYDKLTDMEKISYGLPIDDKIKLDKEKILEYTKKLRE